MTMRAEEDTKRKASLGYYNSEKMLLDHQQFPSLEAFDIVVNNYLQNLSSKKRDKALVDNHRYLLILQVLKDPRNTAISTAQFRFWVKKMFCLSMTQDRIEFVCHDNKPVAIREDIYHILIAAHKEAHHGGRDKTSALVRKRYSWIPKELIARFVRHCPFCVSRRNGTQQHTRSVHLSKKKSSKTSFQPYYCDASMSMAATVATSAAVAAVTSSFLAPSPPLDSHLDFYYPHAASTTITTTPTGLMGTTLTNQQSSDSPKSSQLYSRYLNHSADAAAAVVAAASIAAAARQHNTNFTSTRNCFSQDKSVNDLNSCILPTSTSCAFYSSDKNHSILLSPDSCS